MKKVLGLLFVTLTFCAGAFAGTINIGTYDVSSNSTFFEQSANDNCSSGLATQPCNSSEFNPLVLNLGNLSLAPGDTLQLILSGSACYMGGTQGCANVPLGGVFTSTQDLLGNTNQNRLPTQIASGLPNITNPSFNSYYDASGGTTGHINTQIPDDFYICGTVVMTDCTSTSGTTVDIPTGANFLYVGALDSFYADNGGTLTLTVNEIVPDPTPEPASWAMMLGGLAVTVLAYRRKAAV